MIRTSVFIHRGTYDFSNIGQHAFALPSSDRHMYPLAKRRLNFSCVSSVTISEVTVLVE